MAINALTFNAAQGCSVLFTGSDDKTVKAWDTRSSMKDPIQTLGDFKDNVSDVLCSEFELLTGCFDGQIRCYDVRMGRMVSDHLCEIVTSVRLSKDRNCVLASCLDGALRLMDRASGELLGEYRGHRHSQYVLESLLTHTDAHVVSGSEDGKIYVWDLVDARVAHVLEGHKKAVVSLDYHPSEVCLLSASVDGNVKVWR